MENIDALIEYLINDNPRYHVSEEPETFEDKFRIYRSLVNIRNPNPVDDDYLKILKQLKSDIQTLISSIRISWLSGRETYVLLK